MSDIRQFQLLRLATLFSFLLALINHLLPPKAFPATQLLFDYEFGLARRGLAGEILSALTGDSISVSEIHTAAAAITLIGALTLAAFMSRRMAPGKTTYLILIVLFNSFAFASFVGNSGYLDGLLVAVAVAALMSDGKTPAGLALRMLLCGLGVLIHENMLPYFTVLIGFELYLSRREHPNAKLFAGLPVVAGVGVVAVLAIFAEFSPQQAVDYAVYLQTKAGFGIDPTAADVAGRSIGVGGFRSHRNTVAPPACRYRATATTDELAAFCVGPDPEREHFHHSGEYRAGPHQPVPVGIADTTALAYAIAPSIAAPRPCPLKENREAGTGPIPTWPPRVLTLRITC